MLWEFLLALASGLITTLIATYIQRKAEPIESALEVKAHSESVIVHRTTITNGQLVYEETDTETRISEVTFILPGKSGGIYSRGAPLVAALMVFLIVLAALLVI